MRVLFAAFRLGKRSRAVLPKIIAPLIGVHPVCIC